MPLKVARLRISDYNENRKSKLKNQERRIQMVSLSLTSMVDMFAILVIFLLTNTSTVTQWVEVGHHIDIPKARAAANEAPPKAATLQLAMDSVFADQKVLVSIAQLSQGGLVSEPIRKYLAGLKNDSSLRAGYVNVVAHERLPFSVIKKVVQSAQVAGFPNVNLVVQPLGGTSAARGPATPSKGPLAGSPRSMAAAVSR